MSRGPWMAGSDPGRTRTCNPRLRRPMPIIRYSPVEPSAQPDRASHSSAKTTGAPGRTRTCNPRLRRPMLYPIELRAQTSAGNNTPAFHSRHASSAFVQDALMSRRPRMAGSDPGRTRTCNPRLRRPMPIIRYSPVELRAQTSAGNNTPAFHNRHASSAFVQDALMSRRPWMAGSDAVQDALMSRSVGLQKTENKKMVGVERFELPTHCSQSSCATRLRYTPTRNSAGQCYGVQLHSSTVRRPNSKARITDDNLTHHRRGCAR